MSAEPKRQAVVYCDGASRGNPGEAAAGVAIWDERGESLGTISLYLGRRTNNQAEYAALLAGILSVDILNLSDVEFRLDSELVVKQLNGEYRIKDATLQQLANRVKEAATRISNVRFVHVPRSKNQDADALANDALNSRSAR
ncbi:MAG: ribonuclease HI family protein [Candidatus Hydrogenedentes bacterium]|jgi:ribonuclease HI|nr:ribonuclease HI family protein [Candidatus Hydrogenedentota bacterium]